MAKGRLPREVHCNVEEAEQWKGYPWSLGSCCKRNEQITMGKGLLFSLSSFRSANTLTKSSLKMYGETAESMEKAKYSERSYLHGTKEKLPLCHAFWAKRWSFLLLTPIFKLMDFKLLHSISS